MDADGTSGSGRRSDLSIERAALGRGTRRGHGRAETDPAEYDREHRRQAQSVAQPKPSFCLGSHPTNVAVQLSTFNPTATRCTTVLTEVIISVLSTAPGRR